MPTSETRVLQTRKSQITERRWVTTQPAALQPGQARLRIAHFAFTANNVTYAAFGEAMHYWQFFPQADAEWGCIPVWGYAEVSESLCEGITVGQRFYGYYPFGDELVVTPERVSAAGFVDAAPHRASLHALYNSYSATAGDPSHAPALDAHNALLRPLFITSYLIADFLHDQAWFGADAIVLSSASSKTAYGTAYALKQLLGAPGPRPQVIGLTSASNLAFTQHLGLYDQVLTYEQVSLLAAERPTVYLDFSGSSSVRTAIHNQCQALKLSSAIGGTHWQDLSAGERLPGPRPTLFFAPAQMKKRIDEWGRAVLLQRVGQAMQGFIQAANDPKNPWMKVQWHRGPDEAAQVYDAVIGGRASAELGMMVVP